MRKLVNINKVYKVKKGEDVKALDNINLGLLDKGFTFILGKSGSGKTTLLNILGGLDSYTSGDMIVDGKSTKDFKEKEWNSYRSSYIGFIFQDYNMINEMNVEENIAISLSLQKEKVDHNKISEILKQVGLEGYEKRKINELSGGQKQRITIARALIKNPKVILADEPTGALDSKTGFEIFSLLKELSKTHLVVCVSHDEESAKKWADRIIKISDGKIIEDISKKSYKSDLDKNGLTFSNNVLFAEKGYKLTEKDFKYIQSLIDNSIKFSVSYNENNNDVEEFVSTNTFEIEEALNVTKDFKMKKTKLPFKNVLKLGLNGLKHKKIRLTTTILLGIIGTTLLGFTQYLANYNDKDIIKNTILNDDNSILSLKKTYKNSIRNDDGTISDGASKFYKEDKEFIENNLNIQTYGILNNNIATNSYYLTFQKKIKKLDDYDSVFYNNSVDGYIYYDEEMIKELNYSLYGNAPSSKDEIIIPSYWYYYALKGNKFTYYEYNRESEDWEAKSIAPSSYEDLINKYVLLEFRENIPSGVENVEYFKISGILDTSLNIEYKKEEFNSYEKGSTFRNDVTEDINTYLNQSLNKVIEFYGSYSSSNYENNYVFGENVNYRYHSASTATLKVKSLYNYVSNEKFDNNIFWLKENHTLEDGELILSTTNIDFAYEFTNRFRNINDRGCIKDMSTVDKKYRTTFVYHRNGAMNKTEKKDWTSPSSSQIFDDLYHKYFTTGYVEWQSADGGWVTLFTMINNPITAIYYYLINNYSHNDFVKNKKIVEYFNNSGYIFMNYLDSPELFGEECLHLALYLMSGNTNILKGYKETGILNGTALFNEYILSQNGWNENKITDDGSGYEIWKKTILNIVDLTNEFNDKYCLNDKAQAHFDYIEDAKKNTFKLNFENGSVKEFKIAGVILESSNTKYSVGDVLVNENDFIDLIQNDKKSELSIEKIGTYKYLFFKKPDSQEKINNLINQSYSSYSSLNDLNLDKSSIYYNYLYLLSNKTDSNGLNVDKFNVEISASYAPKLKSLGTTLSSLNMYLYIGGGIFTFITIAIFINYISTSIEIKKKEIGILRCLGLSKANSVSIFVIEGGVIAIITALVSSLFTIIGRYILNTIFRNMISISGTIFASNYLIFAIIFAICILTALISVLISSTKIMKQNTIDIVRSE